MNTPQDLGRLSHTVLLAIQFVQDMGGEITATTEQLERISAPLFDLDELETAPADQPKAPKRLYIWRMYEGVRYFLYETHANGGPIWTEQAKCGRKRPLWFANIHTARNAVVRYNADGYDVWNDQGVNGI